MQILSIFLPPPPQPPPPPPPKKKKKKKKKKNTDDISSKLSPIASLSLMETICMNVKPCFLGKNKKNISKCHQLKFIFQSAKR